MLVLVTSTWKIAKNPHSTRFMYIIDYQKGQWNIRLKKLEYRMSHLCSFRAFAALVCFEILSWNFAKELFRPLSNRILMPKCYNFSFNLSTVIGPILNGNTSKGNHAPIKKIERPNQKMTKSKKLLTSVKIWCPQLTWKLIEAISPKIWLESKQMKINDVFYCFTSKAYSAAISRRNFHLYHLTVPKQLTRKYHTFTESWEF